MKTVLITGASRGLGLSLAKVFSQGGYKVFATYFSSIGELSSIACTPMYLDVSSDAVKAALQNLKIDVLINNAGYAVAGAVEEVDIDLAKKMFEVNVWGVIRMCQAVIPTMRVQKSGLIVNISSIAGHLSHDGMGVYAASKHALEALTDSMALELKLFGITVIDIEPQAMVTDFGSSSLQGKETIANVHSPYAPMYKTMLNDLKNLHLGMKSNKAAREILNIVESKNPPRHNPLGNAVFLKRLDKFAPQMLKSHLENKILKERWKS